MSRGPLCKRSGRSPSRLLVTLLLLLGVVAMHQLTVDHGMVAGSPSMSAAYAPASGLTEAASAAPAHGVEAALPAMNALPELMPGMTSMLGGMCLAVLLAAGVRLLVRRARTAGRRPRLVRTRLPRLSLGLVSGHDPPGSLLLRLCVMRT